MPLAVPFDVLVAESRLRFGALCMMFGEWKEIHVILACGGMMWEDVRCYLTPCFFRASADYSKAGKVNCTHERGKKVMEVVR